MSCKQHLCSAQKHPLLASSTLPTAAHFTDNILKNKKDWEQILAPAFLTGIGISPNNTIWRLWDYLAAHPLKPQELFSLMETVLAKKESPSWSSLQPLWLTFYPRNAGALNLLVQRVIRARQDDVAVTQFFALYCQLSSKEQAIALYQTVAQQNPALLSLLDLTMRTTLLPLLTATEKRIFITDLLFLLKNKQQFANFVPSLLRKCHYLPEPRLEQDKKTAKFLGRQVENVNIADLLLPGKIKIINLTHLPLAADIQESRWFLLALNHYLTRGGKVLLVENQVAPPDLFFKTDSQFAESI